MKKKLLVLMLRAVGDSSLALTLDSIGTANRLAALRGQPQPWQVTLFGAGRRSVRTAAGASFAVQPKARAADFDALVVPGLGLATAEEIDDRLRSRSTAPALKWLREQAPRCPVVAASCSSVFLLAEAGLLENRLATTTWWLAPAFRKRYPGVALEEERMVTEDAGLICAGAALAQLDLMLHLIARLGSPKQAREVARYLAIERRPSQARYMVLSAMAGIGESVAKAETWVHRNIGRRFTISELARSLGLSPRTLDRRLRAATGAGASRFVQRLRVEHAAHLIETTELPLTEVAEAVGYRDASTLRRVIQRQHGLNPSELRGSESGRRK